MEILQSVLFCYMLEQEQKRRKSRKWQNNLLIILQILWRTICAQYTVEEYAKIQAEIQKIVRLSKKPWKDQRQTYSYKELDRLLSGINEKQKIRKVRGVYYTPEDVVRFILKNSALLLYKKAYGIGVLDEAGVCM